VSHHYLPAVRAVPAWTRVASSATFRPFQIREGDEGVIIEGDEGVIIEGDEGVIIRRLWQPVRPLDLGGAAGSSP
jgi:hypothetical protein